MIERESIPLMRIRHEFKEDHLDSSGGKLIRKDCFYAQQQLNWPVYTNGVEFTERNAPTWYHDPCNRYFLIVFLQEGEIRYSAGGEKFLFRANRILLIPRGMDYRFETLRNPHYRKTTLFLLGVNLPVLLETLNLNRPMLLTPDAPGFHQQSVEELYTMVKSGDRKNLPRNMGITLELLGRISEFTREAPPLPLALRIAKSRLSSDFRNHCPIAVLAEELRMPLRTFNRMFRDHLGISPHEFRRRCRVETAKEYLNHTNASVKEIAERLGYCNAFHFSGEFRRAAGSSPLQFRTACRQKKDPE